MLPMSYSSIGASSSHANGMEDEVIDSRPTRCVCNLQIIKFTYKIIIIIMQVTQIIYLWHTTNDIHIC